MHSIDRRRFLLTSAAAAASLKTFAQDTAAPMATLKLLGNRPGAAVPPSFIGLSYEVQQLSEPEFFSPGNKGLIAQFRALAPHGVLRLGGNTSDVGWWKPTKATKRPSMENMHRDAEAGEPTVDLAYPVEPVALTNLRGFLDATGWTCLLGINLGTNTPEVAADEAVVAARALGSRLEYFQLGNEPDLFSRHMRDPKTWSADIYFDEWLRMANAIRAKVPGAKFGLPDTSGAPNWYAKVVERLTALPAGERPQIAALSHHYYFGGPPSNPDVNIGRLLHAGPDNKVQQLANNIREAAERLSAAIRQPVPYRMTEGNTCYRGGKPGVSDVFAASLWAADYCLTLASLGYAGVNLHGGDGQMVANSLGGTLPGEKLMADPSVPHARPFYTPIAHIGSDYVFEPVAYGMLFAGHFAGATMIPVEWEPAGVNATAFAARDSHGGTLVAIVNKDTAKDVAVNLMGMDGPVPRFRAAEHLGAPSLESKQVTLREQAGSGNYVVPRSSATIFRRANR